MVYISVFALALSSFTVVIRMVPSPESALVGQWQEVEWRYGAVKSKAGSTAANQPVPDEVKQQLARHLLIHQAEKWHFLPDGTVLLHAANRSMTAKWRIKGRGHMLALTYDNQETEYYSLAELSGDRLMLYLELDTHIKGTVKLIFKKT